jgi:hypothetical protein
LLPPRKNPTSSAGSSKDYLISGYFGEGGFNLGGILKEGCSNESSRYYF